MPNSPSELIPIHKRGDEEQWVDARTLYSFLESKQEFANWIKPFIEDYGFIEGRDFLTNLSKSTGGRPAIDYSITIDMAKHLAMLQRNEKGMQARQYFIQAEKQLRQLKSALLHGFDEVETILKTCSSIQLETGTWYVATQLRRMCGKCNVKTDEMQRKVQLFPEQFMKHSYNGNSVWWVRRDAVQLLLGVKPNQMIATAMVKLLNAGGVQ